MRLYILILGCLLFFGCMTIEDKPPQNITTPPIGGPEMTCEEFCPTQPHIQCVGSWDISGTYPNCVCNFECTIEEVPEENQSGDVTSPISEELDIPSTNKTIGEMLDDGMQKLQSKFYTDHSGSFTETRYKWRRFPINATPQEIVADTTSAFDMRFDGDVVQSIQTSGAIVFMNTETEQSEIFGLAIFKDRTTPLDTYPDFKTTFDVEFLHPNIAKELHNCQAYEKVYHKNLQDEWLLTYYFECEEIQDR